MPQERGPGGGSGMFHLMTMELATVTAVYLVSLGEFWLLYL